MSFRGNLLRAGIDSDGKVVTVYRNDGRLDVATASAKATGTIRSANFAHTHTALTAGINEVLRAYLATEYRTGTWANAIVGRIDYGTTGDAAGGMAAAICGEINLPAKSMHNLGGNYYCFDAEIEIPDNCVLNDSATYFTAFLKMGLWGTDKGEFDDHGYFFHTDGLAAGAGHVLSENSRTLRVNIEGTSKYIYLSDTEDDLGTMVVDTITINMAGTDGIIFTGTASDCGLDLGAATCSTADIRLQQGATILNEAPGAWHHGGAIVLSETISTINAGGFYYGLLVLPTITADQSGQIGGASIYTAVTGVGTTVSTLNGMELVVDASNASGGGGAGGTYFRGMLIQTTLGTNSWSEMYGLDLWNYATTSLTAGIRISGPVTIGLSILSTMTTGIDMSSGSCSTADITLQNGATILNEAPGAWHHGGAMVLSETIDTQAAGGTFYYGLTALTTLTADQTGQFGGATISTTVTGDGTEISTLNGMELVVTANNANGGGGSGGTYFRGMMIQTTLATNTWSEMFGLDLWNYSTTALTAGMRLSGPMVIGLSLIGTMTTGISITGTTDTGIDIGACTTGITLSGAMTTGLYISGYAPTGIRVGGVCNASITNLKGMYLETTVGNSGVLTGWMAGIHIETYVGSVPTVPEHYGILVQTYSDIAGDKAIFPLRLDHGGASVAYAFISLQGSPRYFLQSTNTAEAWCGVTQTSSSAVGWLKVRLGGYDRYINLYDDTPSG